ncbi:MAG TPA: SdrD B-like domain-containing protein [Gemmataceae bacterium]|jgi:hypothetical protein|nr:SdrD B-like domain-containing protein [Gemmataceae bacterium]
MTIIPSWLRVRLKLNRKARRAAARRCRPCLERLEDRTTPSTFTVVNTYDTSNPNDPNYVGSLRWAINQANADTDLLSNINFNIPGSGAQTISVTSDLPGIMHPVVINGFSEPGSSANTQAIGDNAVRLIDLDASQDTGATGLTLVAGDSTVRGLTISHFAVGIWLPMNNGNSVSGCNITSGGIEIGSGGGGPGSAPYTDTDNAPIVTFDQAAFLADPSLIPVVTYPAIREAWSIHPGFLEPEVYSNNNVIGGTSPGDRNLIATDGIQIQAGNSNILEGNYIGVDATGNQSVSNGRDEGVNIIFGSYNVIGGTTAGAGNVISGGLDVFIGSYSLSIATHNVVQGNFLGTNATGDAPLAISGGLAIGYSAFDLIGGSTPGAGNVISGAVNLGFFGGEVIQGNLISTDFTATGPIPDNGISGISYYGGQGDVIGGTEPGQGNIIAFNEGDGIKLYVSGAQVLGNNIHDNAGPGVEVVDNPIKSEQILGNSIHNNNGPGVWVRGNPLDLTYEQVHGGGPYIPTGIDIQRNSIYGNFGLGIDLGAIPVDSAGVPTSDINAWRYDIPDLDNPPQNGSPVGINNGQTFPTNLSASATGSSISISGTLQSPNTAPFTLDFYANPSPDPSGYGQGQTWLGETTVGSGQTSFVANLAVGNLAGQYITATATDSNPNPDTSEFAKDVQAATAPSQTFAQYLASVLPANSITIEASTSTTPATVISAVNGLTGVTQPVTIILDLMGGTWSSGGVAASPPPNVTFEIKNGTLDPTYPALTVAGGVVEVSNCTLTTSGENPTILVTGGSLTLRSDVVQESTGFGDPAISVTGGTLDLGTATSPGRNVVNINGVGQLVSNTTANVISAVGTTFEDNGASIQPSSLLGFVWADFNNDGQIDFGESGISGVSIHLQGRDFLGRAVDQTITADSSGSYQFNGLLPGSYTVTAAQPNGYTAGVDSVGTINGVVTGTVSGANQFTIYLPDSVDAMNYNFGELPANGSNVQHGQTAGIGFWNNRNGQALIKSLNSGSSSTQLGNWLADTFKNIFGVNAGSNNLAGKTNAQVAAAFQQKFVVRGQKLDAQVMATALSVYVTNQTLAGTTATAYGFTVSQYGAGIATVNVGNDGAAVGQANGTTMSIMDILLAADALSANDHGVLYGGDTTKRNEANDLFSAINLDGGI